MELYETFGSYLHYPMENWDHMWIFNDFIDEKI